MSFKRALYLTANRSLAALPLPLRKMSLAAIAALPFDRRLPRFMTIEPTNNCNLHCPLCPVGAETMTRPRGLMDLDNYKRLIDEIAPHTTQVLMNFAGEPLLHPDIGEMVAYAEQHGIAVTLGTNGNIDRMQDLIDAGTSKILFALDGTTEDVYQQYRVGGKLELALANLDKLTTARDHASGKRTHIILQFVVMQHNQHQIVELEAIGRRMGVDEISLQPVCVNDFFPTDRGELVRRWVPAGSDFVLHPGFEQCPTIIRPPLCVWAIQSVVLFNGDVTICCFDTDGSHIVGNAFSDGGFRKIWRSPHYRDLRRQIIRQNLSVCHKCDISLTKPTRFAPVSEYTVQGI